MIPRAVRHSRNEQKTAVGIVIDVEHGHVRLRDASLMGVVTAKLPSHISSEQIRLGDHVVFQEQNGDYLVVAHYGPVLSDGRSVTTAHKIQPDAPSIIDLSLPLRLGLGLQYEHNQGVPELTLARPLNLGGSDVINVTAIEFANGVSFAGYEADPGRLRLEVGTLYGIKADAETMWELEAGGRWNFTRAAGLQHGPEFTPSQFYWYTRGGVPIFRCGDARVEIGVEGSDRMLIADSEGGLRIHGSVIMADTLDAESIGPKLTRYISRIIGNNPIVVVDPEETRSPWQRGVVDDATYVALQFASGLELWLKRQGYANLPTDTRIFYVGPQGLSFGLPGKEVRMSLTGDVIIPADLLVGGRLRVNQYIEIGEGNGDQFSGVYLSSNYGFVGRSPGDSWSPTQPGGTYQVWWDRASGQLRAAMGDIVIGRRGLQIHMRNPRADENPAEVSARRTLRWVNEDGFNVAGINCTPDGLTVFHHADRESSLIQMDRGDIHIYAEPVGGFIAQYAGSGGLLLGAIGNKTAYIADEDRWIFYNDVAFGNYGWKFTKDGKLVYSSTNDVSFPRAALTIGTPEFDYGSYTFHSHVELRVGHMDFFSISGITWNDSYAPLFYSRNAIVTEVMAIEPIRNFYSHIGRDMNKWRGVHTYALYSNHLVSRSEKGLITGALYSGRHGVLFGLSQTSMTVDIPNLPIGSVLYVETEGVREYMRTTSSGVAVNRPFFGTVYEYGVERGYGGTSPLSHQEGRPVIVLGRSNDLVIELYGEQGLFGQPGPGLAVYYRHDVDVFSTRPALYAGLLFFYPGRNSRRGLLFGDYQGAHLVWDRESGLAIRFGDADRLTLDTNGVLSVVGSLAASSGSLAGWTLSANALMGANVILSSTGFLQVGSDSAIVRLDSGDPYWRLWVGGTTPGTAPFRVRTDGYVYVGQIQINRAGFFNNAPLATKPTVTGSRGGNAALASLLSALASYGLITDGTAA